MKCHRNVAIGLVWNTVYFACAAAATIYVTSESWHYGFWFTPFPILLTAMAVLFIGATTVGVLCFEQKYSKFLLLASFVASWTAVALAGATLWHFPARFELLGYFLSVVLSEIAAIVFLALRSTSLVSDHFSERALNAVRLLAVLLPLPIFAYAGLSFCAQHFQDNSEGSTVACAVFVKSERFLFGFKRADAHCQDWARQQFRKGNLQLTKQYAVMGLNNAVSLPWTRDKAMVERRHAEWANTVTWLYAGANPAVCGSRECARH